MNWQDFITFDPQICHGKACIKGTRIMASVVLDNLAAGHSIDEIIAAYPSLSEKAIRAVITFAAELAKDRFVELPVD